MGTLHDQKPRDHNSFDSKKAIELIDEILDVADATNISFNEALRVYELLEQKRKTDCYVDNGDAWDEQISGIGTILERIASALENLEQED